MKQIVYIGLLFILISCNEQTKESAVSNKNYSKEQYSNFVLLDNKIIALSTTNKLVQFNREGGDREELNLDLKTGLIQISADKRGYLIVCDSNNVYKIQDNKSENIYHTKVIIKNILFDNGNNCFLITDKGILNTKTDSLYFPDASFNKSVRSTGEWFKKPVCLIDKEDNIWVGFGYGEWGGDLFIFDTKSKKFILPNIESFHITGKPIISFTEGENKVYVGSGLMHFMTSGSIAVFENFKSKKIFESDAYPQNERSSTLIEGEYIGPIYYKNGSLYFYSQNGIFKGDINSDLTTLKNWTLLLKPKLKWSDGQPDAVGSPMNVLKLVVLEDEEIIFLSQGDGIGIFKDNKLIMLN